MKTLKSGPPLVTECLRTATWQRHHLARFTWIVPEREHIRDRRQRQSQINGLQHRTTKRTLPPDLLGLLHGDHLLARGGVRVNEEVHVRGRQEVAL